MTEGQSTNPAWDDLLSQLPEEYHVLAKPVLEKWDKTFQDQLVKYEPYKPLLENNVDIDYIDQAIYLAQQLQSNPQEVLDRAIEAFNLPYTKGDGTIVPNPEPEEFDGVDITTHPQYKELFNQVSTMQEQWNQRQQKEEQDQQLTQTQQYIENLHKSDDGTRVEFDDMYVAALISAGVDGKKAVEQYQTTINEAAAKYAQAQLQKPEGQQQQQSQQFTVLGGDTGGGSGIPNQPVDFAAMKRNDVNEVVMQMLRNSQNT